MGLGGVGDLFIMMIGGSKGAYVLSLLFVISVPLSVCVVMDEHFFPFNGNTHFLFATDVCQGRREFCNALLCWNESLPKIPFHLFSLANE